MCSLCFRSPLKLDAEVIYREGRCCGLQSGVSTMVNDLELEIGGGNLPMWEFTLPDGNVLLILVLLTVSTFYFLLVYHVDYYLDSVLDGEKNLRFTQHAGKQEYHRTE